ncbi:MAG: ATP-dependent DNA helicase RecG [Candidatus Amulumruptor caecigallinarius]|nr:ATP-dependent DNA helicase RecG [Candidatus Amulumruptor caecigallinarius]
MKTLLDTNIQYLKGVGEKRAKLLLDEYGISTYRDLAHTFPFRHIDKSKFYKIRDFHGDMPSVQVRGRFISFDIEGEGVRKRLVALFSDGDRLMQVVWFSRIHALKDAYHTGVDYVIFGKPTPYRGDYSMTHPEVSQYNPGDVPKGFRGIYSISEKMRKAGYSSRFLSGLMEAMVALPQFKDLPDTLPVEILRKYNLLGYAYSIRQMHFPESVELLQKARERLKFEELFYLELHILRFARERGRRTKGMMFPRIGEYFNGFYSNCMPFELTDAQKRVLKEIRADMRTGKQMNRLLQGDVGSGKTMVAFMTMLIGVDNGCQAALMAPTEILATQHFETIHKWGHQIGLNVRLLTGSTRTAERCEILSGLLSGSVNIIVGTHALIEAKVEFKNLGVAVIDEQHRFGVAQRAKLWGKRSVAPHVLVMTATPIPRTLAMTVYGDLDVSVIDELPPGRKPVTTMLRYDDNRMEVNRLLARELAEGRQVYVVYPLVADNPKLEYKSVETGYERICGIFPQYKVSCVHGKMKADVKDAQMQRFASGEARILVATTVIEVGVNVPNASVMLIENAERFGLSQLHQLRGRVGRGSEKSYCILVTKPDVSGDTKKRLKIMTETSDGFLISEADMKIRGPGDMEGTQQSGIAFDLRIANLTTDGQILNVARDAATKVLDAHPELFEKDAAISLPAGDMIQLSTESVNLLKEQLRYRYGKKIDWSMIS